MITNSNDITKYTNYNKQYIPQELNNSNYIYQYNGDYIHIITNQNCTTNQYNQMYCNCNNYNWKTNVSEITYQCRRDNQYSSISYATITSDINYSGRIREYFIQDKGIIMLMIGIGIIFAIMISRVRSMRV